MGFDGSGWFPASSGPLPCQPHNLVLYIGFAPGELWENDQSILHVPSSYFNRWSSANGRSVEAEKHGQSNIHQARRLISMSPQMGRALRILIVCQ